MKLIVAVFGLLISTSAFAAGLAEMSAKDRCGFWASNAMYGASQSMRGASREVEFISRSTLREILTRPERIGSEKLYIVDEEGYTDVERGFLARSTLFGYDEMSIWKSRDASFRPIRDEWWQRFMAMCLEQPAI